jgi:hypothetical protein
MQQPMMDSGGGMMMDDPGMQQMGASLMRLMLYVPQHLLARQAALGLTPAQVTRLTALRDGTKTTHDAARGQAMMHLKELGQAANAAQPDTGALKTHFQAAHTAMAQVRWAMLAAAVQARAVLTDAQRASLQAWADSMQARRQRRHPMMHPAPPH